MSKNIITRTTSIKSKQGSGSPVRTIISEDLILKTRKHTIPIPFFQHSKVKQQKKSGSYKNLNPHSNYNSVLESNRSTKFVFTSRKTENFQRVKSAMKSRAITCSPIKKVQFQINFNEPQLNLNKQKQWKKIFSSIKSNFSRGIQAFSPKSTQKKIIHTIKDINQM
jgi:hypothetical protein